VEAGDGSIQNKVPKEFMILQANTVAYPGTVVVHPHYASIANRAMVCSLRLYFLTGVAVSNILQISN
jgi:uncharacterized membrane protein (DUF106 family)